MPKLKGYLLCPRCDVLTLAREPCRQCGQRVKRSKYHNVKTTVEGIVFDSRKESQRWVRLRQWERTGRIADLKRQVPLKCVVAGVLICTYKADFRYRIVLTGTVIYEDVKSKMTARLRDYKIKKKLVFALHRIAIQEVFEP